MKNALLFLFLLIGTNLFAQVSSLTVGQDVYNQVRYILPIKNDWLVIADVAGEDNYYRLTPRFFRLSPEGNLIWSVSLAAYAFDAGTTNVHYDSSLQQIYLVHGGEDCDAVSPDVVYSYDVDGNLLWSATFEPLLLISYNTPPNTVAMIPGVGLLRQVQGNEIPYSRLRLQPADGSAFSDYAISEFYDGIYHLRHDTLLLTRAGNLMLATLDDDTLTLIHEQTLGIPVIGKVHLLNANTFYTKSDNQIRRYTYQSDSGSFTNTGVAIIPNATTPYRITLGQDALYLTGQETVTVYDLDLEFVEEHQLSIPGTALSGTAAKGTQLLTYGNTQIFGNLDFRFPREGFLYDLTAAPALGRDLAVGNITSAGLSHTDLPEGLTRSVIDSIQVTIRNEGTDTVSALKIKIQKSLGVFICPSSVILQQTFQNIELLPGDSITFFMGTLQSNLYFGPLICAWVGTDLGPVETDYTNNVGCVEVDLINSTNAPSEFTQLVVFPNPTIGVVQVTNAERWQDYQLYDARGVLLRSGPLAGEQTATFDLSALPAGLYHILLREGKRAGMARVVKR